MIGGYIIQFYKGDVLSFDTLHYQRGGGGGGGGVTNPKEGHSILLSGGPLHGPMRLGVRGTPGPRILCPVGQFFGL